MKPYCYSPFSNFAGLWHKRPKTKYWVDCTRGRWWTRLFCHVDKQYLLLNIKVIINLSLQISRHFIPQQLDLIWWWKMPLEIMLLDFLCRSDIKSSHWLICQIYLEIRKTLNMISNWSKGICFSNMNDNTIQPWWVLIKYYPGFVLE